MGGTRGVAEKHIDFRFRCHAQISPEVLEPTIKSYAVIPPRMSILEAYPPIPLSGVANWSAKMRSNLRTGKCSGRSFLNPTEERVKMEFLIP
jgi:hypothetical protein